MTLHTKSTWTAYLLDQARRDFAELNNNPRWTTPAAELAMILPIPKRTDRR